MGVMEINSSSAICRCCGKSYSRLKGFFPVSYSPLYKGVGYLPYCNDCIDNMYDAYTIKLHDNKLAIREMCRKLDLYWNVSLYEGVEKKSASRSLMRSYISRTNGVKLAGLCFDDTIREEGVIKAAAIVEPEIKEPPVLEIPEVEEPPVDEEVLAFWGPGYTGDMYRELEQRRAYWMSGFQNEKDVDMGTKALIRQICNLEIDINRDRAAGRDIDKKVNSLNSLLGSAMLKPTQKKDEVSGLSVSNPYGVWIKKIEDTRPVSEPSPEFKDVDGVVKYITTWFLGHLCKMLGIKNTYCKLYEDEIMKMRVGYPEYSEDDDETLFNDVFSSAESDDE